MTNGKVICLGNQKGGVGKSTLTSMVANYFHKKNSGKVVVVDSDDLQNTLLKIRSEESEAEGVDEAKLYPILQVNSADFEEQVEALRSEYKYIFIDLPGNLKQKGVIASYSQVDYLFIPLAATRVDVESTIDFIDFVNLKLKPHRTNLGLPMVVYGLFNRVKPKTVEYREIKSKPLEMGIPMLTNFVTETVAMQRGISTIENSSAENKRVCEEIWAIVKK